MKVSFNLPQPSSQRGREKQKREKKGKRKKSNRLTLQLPAKIQARGLTSDLNALATVDDPTRTITLLILDRAGVDSGT